MDGTHRSKRSAILTAADLRQIIHVVPANAGTHTALCPRLEQVADSFRNHNGRGVWVPAFAGTTKTNHPTSP
jgi:hypothetical protein